MKRTLLLSMIAAGALAAPLAFAEDGKSGDHGKKHHKGHMMEKVDANGDGAISKDEFMARHEEMFNKMDADGDGSISKEEMKAGMEAKREKMKEFREKRKDRRDADKPTGNSDE